MGDGTGTALNAERIAQWKSEYGRIIGIEDPAEMVFRKPARHVWAEFLDSVTKQKGTHDAAYRLLCTRCTLYPEPEQARAIFDEYPGLCVTMGDALGELAGHKGAIDIKKY